MTEQSSDAPADTITAEERERARARPSFGAGRSGGLRVEKIAEGATEVFAPMRDRLEASPVTSTLPEGEGPFPSIVTRTPYGKDTMELFSDPRAARKYTKAGYAYLVQDTRGKGRSEGHYGGFTDDRNDGYDTIEWIARQSWCDGKVGVTGASAMGITTNMAAIANPPHLVAAFVIVAGNDTAFVGGAFKQRDMGDWNRGQGVAEERIRSERRLLRRHRALGDRRASSTTRASSTSRSTITAAGNDLLQRVGNVRNFQQLQNHGSRGARGNQKLEMGPFGHGEMTGDLAYPGGSGPARQSQRDPLVRLLAEGRRQRHHG